MIKIIAWNVNSIRSLVQKQDLDQFLKKKKCQIFCMSETKLTCPDLITRKDLSEKISGFRYRYYSTCSVKKGYSGTAIYSKKKPIDVTYGIGEAEHDNEGRVITLKFKEFILVHVYTPNSGQVLQRLNYRVNKWDKSFFKYIQKINKEGNVILCGDLNVARYDIDIHSPKTNLRSAGFTKEERNSFNSYVDNLNLIDTYRYLNPDKQEFTYWSYLRESRKNNKGWRIDYFLIGKKLENKLKKSYILTDQMGSDHAPIVLELKL